MNGHCSESRSPVPWHVSLSLVSFLSFIPIYPPIPLRCIPLLMRSPFACLFCALLVLLADRWWADRCSVRRSHSAPPSFIPLVGLLSFQIELAFSLPFSPRSSPGLSLPLSIAAVSSDVALVRRLGSSRSHLLALLSPADRSSRYICSATMLGDERSLLCPSPLIPRRSTCRLNSVCTETEGAELDRSALTPSIRPD